MNKCMIYHIYDVYDIIIYISYHDTGEGQRYWLNKQFWGGKGFPIFVYIGGEGG